MSTGYGDTGSGGAGGGAGGGCAESVALGAYLLGALSPAERQRMERHIADCPVCRAEIVQLAPLPGLLRHTPFEELPDAAAAAGALHTPPRPVEAAPPRGEESGGAATPSEAPPSGTGQGAGQGAAQHQHQHRQPRRRSRRVLVGAGLALAGVAAGAGLYAGLSGGPTSGEDGRHATSTLSASDPRTHVSAAAALTPEAWGTWMRLTLRGLPAGTTCHMVVHARNGTSETAGTWGSGYSATATVPASTSVSPQDISSLTVLDAGGRTLVTLPQAGGG